MMNKTEVEERIRAVIRKLVNLQLGRSVSRRTTRAKTMKDRYFWMPSSDGAVVYVKKIYSTRFLGDRIKTIAYFYSSGREGHGSMMTL